MKIALVLLAWALLSILAGLAFGKAADIGEDHPELTHPRASRRIIRRA